MEKLIRFFKDEEGATAVEYGLMAALIAAVIVAAVTLLGGTLAIYLTRSRGQRRAELINDLCDGGDIDLSLPMPPH